MFLIVGRGVVFELVAFLMSMMVGLGFCLLLFRIDRGIRALF